MSSLFPYHTYENRYVHLDHMYIFERGRSSYNLNINIHVLVIKKCLPYSIPDARFEVNGMSSFRRALSYCVMKMLYLMQIIVSIPCIINTIRTEEIWKRLFYSQVKGEITLTLRSHELQHDRCRANGGVDS